jgi:gamma-glutamyltranspeptidase / glutathione hydrolase
MSRFALRKQPVMAARGMVVANHPLASAAGAEVLLAGGNAVDAAVATLFALSVVEPMMVSPLGGGVMHLRLPDGTHRILDGLSTAPAASQADQFEPLSDGAASARDTKGRLNEVGAQAIANPAALFAWAELHRQHGRLPFADLVDPAIRLARKGFVTSVYLSDCATDRAPDIAKDKYLARLFLPDGAPIEAGARLVQLQLAESLQTMAREGEGALRTGALGRDIIRAIRDAGGMLDKADLATYRPLWREPIRSSYRGVTILGPPPPAASGVHIAQMLNLLEPHDLRRMEFGSADASHLLAEVMKIAFADRAVALIDPDFGSAPMAELISKAYAAKRQKEISLTRAGKPKAGLALAEGANTTHLTIADSDGMVVAATQTINSLFGACVSAGETGLLANNYMFNFDPHPGRPLSIQPGKRCFTSMAPMMALRGKRLVFALGLPGGLRIFPSALQAIVNLVDHRMSLQEAVEAPRLWTEGGMLELEPGFSADVSAKLQARGHSVLPVNRVAGGMNGIAFDAKGRMTGAACWRADGVPVGISGGFAAAGVRFSI